jgi:hypothetical protein
MKDLLLPLVYCWTRTLDGSQIQKNTLLIQPKKCIDKLKNGVAAYFVTQKENFKSYNEGNVV